MTLCSQGEAMSAEKGWMAFQMKLRTASGHYGPSLGFSFIPLKGRGWTHLWDLFPACRLLILVTGSSSDKGRGHTVYQNTCTVELQTSKEILQN